MAQSSNKSSWSRLGAGVSLLTLSSALCIASPAAAQNQPAPAADDVVVVTGFRESLAAAIDAKREDAGIVDVITAEDIADFPDLNLAESLQRVPGVQIDRDGGEGRTINVRGLSSDFVRVRLNGMEALATTGGRDGRQNRNRAFDFNVFASELFNSIKVSKSQAAEVEEGSLGATVDLTTARPFDYNDFTMAGGIQASYNDLARNTDPRYTFLIADQFLDGQLGVLFSVAYATRNTIEEGSSSLRFRIPGIDGAITPDAQGNLVRPDGTCQLANNRFYQSVGAITGTVSQTCSNLTPDQNRAMWSAHPRIPRYGRMSYDRERLGSTFSVQYQPFESTTFGYDLLYANLTETRHEEFLEAISFARETAVPGLRATDLVSGTVDASNTLVSAVFDDVDIRVEQRRDNLETEFFQNVFRVDHEFASNLKGEFVAGHTRAVQYNPEQTTLSFERYDVDGYSYDYSNPNLPAFNYGFDVTNPANFLFSNSAALGDASIIRMRPNKAVNTFLALDGRLVYEFDDVWTFKGGVTQKTFEFTGTDSRRSTEALPPGLLAALATNGNTITDYSTLLTGFGRGMKLPAGTPTSWVVPSINKLNKLINFECDCVNTFGDFRTDSINSLGENRSAEEKSTGFWIQGDFNFDLGTMPVRGNIGVRRVKTELNATGYTNFGSGAVPTTVENSYSRTLPSANVSIEPIDNVLVRFAAAKTIARPSLPALTPGGSIDVNPPGFSINAGNPFLEPIESTNFDVSFEWYPYDEALFAVAFFQKDIDTFVQRLRQLIPYNQTGFPDSLLPSGVSNTELFDTNTFLNTPGGELTGYEITAQTPFTFLPGPFDRFGGQLSYTSIDSEVSYVLAATIGAGFVQAPLTGQSPKSVSATIYYEDGPFRARVSAVSREEYLTLVPAASGNDFEGKADMLNVDFSASYQVNDNFTLTFEAINLTDQYDERWISSARHNNLNYEHTGREFVIGGRYKY